MALKRLNKELTELNNPASKKPLPPNCTAASKGDDMFNWSVSIPGPEGSPYEGSRYELSINFREGYPFKAPSVKFATKIFHCNVNPDSGEMCLSLLGENEWAPSVTTRDIIMAVLTLLATPDASNPMNQPCCELLKNNEAEYRSKIQEWKNQFATPL